MNRAFQPAQLDVAGFAEAGAALSDTSPLADWPRLRLESQPTDAGATVHWDARGELRQTPGTAPQAWVNLSAGTSLHLICQRCLTPVAVDLAVDRRFHFVADEETASMLDDEIDDADVLALSPRFDLLNLIEDELLLALPLVPLHETCPVPVPSSASDPDFDAGQRDHPFAVLGRLKPPEKP